MYRTTTATTATAANVHGTALKVAAEAAGASQKRAGAWSATRGASHGAEPHFELTPEEVDKKADYLEQKQTIDAQEIVERCLPPAYVEPGGVWVIVHVEGEEGENAQQHRGGSQDQEQPKPLSESTRPEVSSRSYQSDGKQDIGRVIPAIDGPKHA